MPEKDDHNMPGARDIADRLMASFGSMLLYWYHWSHNGKRIDVETEVGRGSTFRVDLTLERDEAKAKQELSDLARESEILKARTLARGRAYTRLARAGLLPRYMSSKRYIHE